MQIVIISGSIAQKSHTRSLLQYIDGIIKERGVATIFWDLYAKHMVFAVPELHKNPSQTPDKNVREFISTVDSSDGFIMGSPLYHGSYSGVLKNALDNLYLDALRNKAVGLVGHGHNSRNSIKVCEHLREVVKTLYGYPLQTDICTGTEDFEEVGTGYNLINQVIKDRCLRMVNELINLTTMLRKAQPNIK